MAGKRQIDVEEARDLGTLLGIDWVKVDPEQFRRGLEVELEHGARDPAVARSTVHAVHRPEARSSTSRLPNSPLSAAATSNRAVRTSAYLPGRMGCGTTGEGPHTWMSTLRASVCSSFSTRCTSSSLLQAAQAARSANS